MVDYVPYSVMAIYIWASLELPSRPSYKRNEIPHSSQCGKPYKVVPPSYKLV